jgi:hypothetical protein
MKNWKFHRLLHARGLSHEKLADAIGANRAHLTLTLNNAPRHGRGGATRRRLYGVLTAREIAALGWTNEYRAWRREQKRECSTRNNVALPIMQPAASASRMTDGLF